MEIKLGTGLSYEIIEVCKARKLPRDFAAYILATGHWETNGTLEPVREAYYLGKKAEGYRKKLRYYPWYGRGLVQLTWEVNYVKAGKRLGKDFTTDPDVVMDPYNAVRILVIGMEEGWFTGKKLADDLDGVDESDEEDFLEWHRSRDIVNGTDKANEIAVLAEQYDKALIEIGYDAPLAEVPEEEEKKTWLHYLIALFSLIVKLFK